MRTLCARTCTVPDCNERNDRCRIARGGRCPAGASGLRPVARRQHRDSRCANGADGVGVANHYAKRPPTCHPRAIAMKPRCLGLRAVFTAIILVGVACTMPFGSDPPSSQPTTSVSSARSSSGSSSPSTGFTQHPGNRTLNMVVLVEGSVDDSDLLAHLEIYTHPQNPDSFPRLIKLVDQVGSWEKIQVTLEGVQPNRLYEVRAYYRRCLNSECTRLEPPTGGCAQAAQPTSAGTTFVTVELGNPAGCRIASDTAGFFPPRRSMELTTAPPGQRAVTRPRRRHPIGSPKRSGRRRIGRRMGAALGATTVRGRS